jgi:hypothetical protein
MAKGSLKPAYRAVKAYYETLAQYGDQHVAHETALRSAFQTLLADTARAHAWTLIPELSARATGPGRPGGTGVSPVSHTIRPDGTVRDGNSLPRGYWEAKDTSDDLDAQIVKKTAKGYSLVNTIFEDTRTAVLFQGKREILHTCAAGEGREQAAVATALRRHAGNRALPRQNRLTRLCFDRRTVGRRRRHDN